MVLIYTTCANKKEAQKIAKILIEEKLAACINMFPIESIYHLKGKIKENKEYALLIKTLKRKYDEAEAIIKKIHSYKIPCILRIDRVKPSQHYLEWIVSQVD